jgi:2,5-diamino-6-(ribosylamino)-4(3H)-pyrimidinone 5'-phosphate reductase
MLPRVVYHISCSLDGRIDFQKPDDFLYYRVIADMEFDAILSGSRTIKSAEMPTAEGIEKALNQTLIVVDGKGVIDNWEVIRRQAWWNSDPIVLSTHSAPLKYFEYLEKCGIRYIKTGVENVRLRDSLEELHDTYHIETIRIDSGGVLAGAMLRQGLVNEISIIVKPQLNGGVSPRTIFVAKDLERVEEVVDLELIGNQVVDGKYLWLRYLVARKE